MTRRSIYTKQRGAKVASRAKYMVNGKYHIISSDTNRWVVVADGNIQATRSFISKNAAIRYAKETAEKWPAGEVVIHSKDGQITNRISFAQDF